MRAEAPVPMIVNSEDDLGRFILWRRRRLNLTQEGVAGVVGVEPGVLRRVEKGHGDTLELRVVRLIANALGLNIELRPRDAIFVPVPPKLVSELGLSGDALAALEAAGIRNIEEIPSASDLLARPEFARGVEVYEVVCALNRHGMTVPVKRNHIVPGEREREMFRLRVIDGLTLREIGERFGVIAERVRQIHAVYFGLHGTTPAARPRSRRGGRRRD
jgi:transcriptional regulator with XRE-family HTH domain